MLSNPEPSPFGGASRLRRSLLTAIGVGMLLLFFFGWPLLSSMLSGGTGFAANPAAALTQTPSPFGGTISPTFTPTATLSPTPTLPPGPIEVGAGELLDGLMLLSLGEYGHAQLFAHQLLGEPYTRLTSGPWDDIHPALSPGGTQVAFASNRGGHWDLYVLDLNTGETRQLSDDAAYDGHPTWSPDGAWLAYERYDENNLEIYMRPLDGSLEPVLISAHAGLDSAPAWRPGAQQIAFVSDRDGVPQIWVVDLEQSGGERFRALGGSARQNAPAWSPDGAWLAWSELDGEIWRVNAQDISGSDPLAIGVGQSPQWSPSGQAILATVHNANANYLTAYTLNGGLLLAPELLSGRFGGAAWSAGALPDPLPGLVQAAAATTPNASWAELDPALGDSTAELDDVSAPNAELHEAAVARFAALRNRTAELVGWDALSNLEEAFVPANQPLAPGRQQDWLYTGRAFSLHSSLLSAGWLSVVREEFDGQTYWRVYLRSADQAGGLAQPVSALPWDFSARFNSEAAFQAGGAIEEAPPDGYWVDFTALAAEYGFERLPALSNWRNFYQGTLFNEFALRAGLSWEDAMLQLHSPAVIATLQAGTSE
jgi:TolB protein